MRRLRAVCLVDYDNDDDYLIARVIEIITLVYGGSRKKQIQPARTENRRA